MFRYVFLASIVVSCLFARKPRCQKTKPTSQGTATEYLPTSSDSTSTLTHLKRPKRGATKWSLSEMATDDAIDLIDDVRWTTLCHHFEKLMNEHRMTSIERVNVGAYVVASVIRNMPKDQQSRWLSQAIHEVCSQSTQLNLLPITEKFPANAKLKSPTGGGSK